MTEQPEDRNRKPAPPKEAAAETPPAEPAGKTPQPADAGAEVEEIGGRDGPEPTRFGDWEKNGRCIDF